MSDRELIVDSFAGGGGASLGIALALGRPPDVAINHDRAAIAMHAANHPQTRHLTEDVWKASPRRATRGRPVGLLWASPDCKHFSRAKGGKPVEKSIRSLAWVVVKWAVEASPRLIVLENVREFVERAYWYLVFSWMGLNGISGTPLHHTGTFAVRYSGNGGNGATRWRSVGESIPDWHERLIGVQILSRDAFAILERLDDAEGTAIYVDPPYMTKGAKYVHDFTPEDHSRLALLLRRFRKPRVVVSYYAHPLLADLYAGWQVLDCSVAKSMVNSGRRDQRGATPAPEVLLVNGPVIGNDAAREPAGMFDAMEDAGHD